MTQETNDVVGLIERLLGLHHRDGPPSIYGEAADALQSQSARIAELREGLRIIAKWRDGSPQPDTLSWKRIAKAMQATAHEALTKDSTSVTKEAAK